EHILGPQQARATWLALLNRPAVNMVTRIALAIDDPSYAPALLELLQRRTETPIRAAAIRTLGRMKDPVALGAILDHLSTPELRTDAIEALGDLGDPRAIPHLEPLLDNTTQVAREDERGAMLYV